MNEKEQFLILLNIPKRKLLVKHYGHYCHYGLLLVGIATAIIAVTGRFFVILHATEKLIAATGIILVISIIAAIIKKPNQIDAATVFDEYVKDDRVKTALAFLQDDSMMCQLQRLDTVKQMKKYAAVIEGKKMKVINWKRMLAIFFLLSLATTSFIMPNDVMNTAKQQEADRQLVKESKKDIEKIALNEEKATKQLAELKKLTKDATTSEELLKKLLQKEAGIEEKKQIAEQDEKLLKKLIEGLNDFKALSDALHHADSEKVRKALEELKGNLPTLSEQQQREIENMFSLLTGNEIDTISQLSEEQMKEMITLLEEQLESLISSAQSLNQLALLQEQVQQIATALNQNMNQAGLSNMDQVAFENQNTANPNTGDGTQTQSPSSQNGNKANGSGQGQNGNGSGAANGNGQGSGSGAGSGNGSGSGAGFGQGSRNLTFPEKIGGTENIESDFGQTGEGNGSQQLAPESPVIKGTVRPYEQVYGSYERTFRESVDRMNLPGYLESVVKEYFSDLNPKGE